LEERANRLRHLTALTEINDQFQIFQCNWKVECRFHVRNYHTAVRQNYRRQPTRFNLLPAALEHFAGLIIDLLAFRNATS